jgi:hypothetical protein
MIYYTEIFREIRAHLESGVIRADQNGKYREVRSRGTDQMFHF